MAEAAGVSVGFLTLDLIIKENLQKQLEKIQANYKGAFEQSTAAVKQAVESGVKTAENTTAKAMKTVEARVKRTYSGAFEQAKNDVNSSTESIKSSMENTAKSAEQSVESGMKAVENAYSGAFEQVKNSVNTAAESIQSKIESTAKAGQEVADKAYAKANAAAESKAQEADAYWAKTSEAEKAYFESVAKEQEKAANNKVQPLNTEDVLKHMDEYEEKFKNSTENLKKIAADAAAEMSEKIRKKIGVFEISTKPTQRLQQELENLYDKLETLQSKWQTLKHIEEQVGKANNQSEVYQNVLSDINAVEKQMISLRGTIDQTRAKVNQSVQETSSNTQSIVDKATAEMSQQIRERIGKFEVSSNPTERMQSSLENAMQKMDGLQAKWQELKHIEESFGENDKQSAVYQKTLSDINAIEKQMISLQGTIDQTRAKINQSVNNTQSIVERVVSKISQQIHKKMQSSLENATQKMNELQAKWQELKHIEESFGKNDKQSAVYQKTLSDINSIEKQIVKLQGTIDKTKAKLNESFSEAGQQKNIFFTDLYAKYQGWLNKTNVILRAIMTPFTALINTFESISSTVKNVFSAIGTKIKSVAGTIRNYLENPLYIVRDTLKLVGKGFTALKTIAQKSFTALKATAQKVFPTIKKLAGSALSAFGKKAIEPITSLKSKFEALQNPVKKFATTIKNAAKRVFVMYGVLTVMKSIRSAIETTTKANDEFSKSLNQTKANCNVMFTSIMTAAMPAINAMMSAIEKVTGQMAVFISELLGTTYQKSLDTIKKVKQVGGEAKTQDKKVQNYLSSFDEMNVAQDTTENSSDSDNSESDDDEGIDYSKINPNIELADFAKQLKDSIKAQDWQGVGGLLATKVNSIVDKIDWKKISKKLNSGIENFQKMMNGLVYGIDWKKLGESLAGGITTLFTAFRTWNDSFDDEAMGRSFAEMLNSAIESIDFYDLGDALASYIRATVNNAYGFVTTFDWSGFGTGIGDIVNGWFNGIDWAKTATTLSESIKGILDTLIAFLETVDWEQIGEDIYTFLSGIDWNGIFDRLFKVIGLAIGAILALAKGLLKEKIKQFQEFWTAEFNKFDTGSTGLNIILGLLDGIWQGIKGIGKWIYNHIFKPIWDGIKDVFDIHSPSKKMGELGGFIIDGLLNAVSDGISKIKEIFEKMLEKIHEVFQNIGNWFKARFEDIKDAFKSAPTWFSEKFSDVWKKIKDCFKNLKNWFGEKWQDIKDVFGNVGKWFKDKFSDAWTKIKDVFKGVGDFFDGIWGTIKSKFSSIGTSVGDAIGGAFKTAINAVLSTVEEAINFIPDHINPMLQTLTDWTGISLPYMNTVELPRLAKGGIATAPTLAMVGDNRNAAVDPEVIAPLSKLDGLMTGSNAEVIAMLAEIISILKSQELTVTGEIDGRELWKAWQTMYNENTVRGGF